MNYKEQDIIGTMWRRCHEIHIYNSLNSSDKWIRFDAQDIIPLQDTQITKYVGYISKKFDPEASFPILDPSTGLETGKTATHLDLYNILYSLYIKTAVERDTAELSQPNVGVNISQ